MRIIYTSVKGLRIDGVETVGIEKLAIADKIRERQDVLRKRSTYPEKVSSSLMQLFDDRPLRQAYFRIRGRSYFLDFFFPLRMIAVEIDGSSHYGRKEYDRRRDADFRSIGIRTIRIKNKDVMNGKLFEKFYKRLYK